MNETQKVQKKTNHKIQLVMVVTAILFAVPSLIYDIQNKTMLNYPTNWTFLMEHTLNLDATTGLILFLIAFVFFTAIYFVMIKKEAQIFKSKKQIFYFLIVISCFFTIMVPFGSKDIFAYIGNGWIGAHYEENPYQMSIGEVQEKYEAKQDPMFQNVAPVWIYEKVTYGPISTMLATLFSYLSFGKIDVAICIFKMANLLFHLGSCCLVYQITKKRKFLVLYGLNPVILLEGLTDAHNDLWLVFFLLLAMYFASRKKNLILTTLCVALATAIKYVAILILPFLVFSIVNKQDIKTRFRACVKAGIVFVAMLVICYLPYMRDIGVFAGLFLQQRKV